MQVFFHFENESKASLPYLKKDSLNYYVSFSEGLE